MFKKPITQTLLSSDLADEVFPNIRGNAWNSDVSFLSTLRALAAPRLKEDEFVVFSALLQRYTRERYGSREDAVCSLFDWTVPNMLTFVNICTSENDKWFDFLEKEFESVTGWHRAVKVTAFFAKAMRVLCFISPDLKSSVVITDNCDLRRYHYLQCGIPAYLPWFFDPKKGLEEQELALLTSLRQKTETEYESIIAAMAEKYDFRSMRIRNGLSGFEVCREKAEREKKQNDIRYWNDEITRLSDAIAGYLREIRDAETYLIGLNARINTEGEESQLMKYFLSNPRLVFESIRNNTLTFGVKDYLMFFNEDHVKGMIEEQRSVLFEPNDRPCNNIIPVDDMQMLMREIFLEQNLRIRMCAVYSLTIGGEVNGKGGFPYGPEYDHYMPNPHIHMFSCIGDYRMHINECLKTGNYIGAVEQCAASCRSLNVDDYPVMQEFSKVMYGISGYNHVTNTCIELPDGRVVNPKNAIRFLKGEEIIG